MLLRITCRYNIKYLFTENVILEYRQITYLCIQNKVQIRYFSTKNISLIESVETLYETSITFGAETFVAGFKEAGNSFQDSSNSSVPLAKML